MATVNINVHHAPPPPEPTFTIEVSREELAYLLACTGRAFCQMEDPNIYGAMHDEAKKDPPTLDTYRHYYNQLTFSGRG